MYKLTNTKQYKKDARAMAKQGKDRQKLVDILEKLANGIPLDIKHKDHNLSNNWSGHRECHIEPDWLLIYKIDKKANELRLVRTGSHAELFNESLQLSIKELNRQLSQFID